MGMSANLENEREFLNRVYSTYTVSHSSQTRVMRELIFKTIAPYLRNDAIGLELGCSDGYITEMLAGRLKQLDVIDGSEKFLEEAKKRALKNVNYNYSLFEEMKATAQYDFAMGSYILEHVLDPIPVLESVRKALKPDGLLYVVVPNAKALSRQLALRMGLIPDLKSLTENDLHHGHRRVYDRADLDRDLAKAGFETVSQGGIMLKILADFQMDRLIDDGILKEAQIEGLYQLGLEYPDLSGSLFSICRPRSNTKPPR